MKKLLLIMMCALFLYSCAQDPVESPLPQEEQTEETEGGTRALLPRYLSTLYFSDIRAGGTLTIPSVSMFEINTPYDFSFDPPRDLDMDQIMDDHPDASDMQTSIGIGQGSFGPYNPHSISGGVTNVSLQGHIFTTPGYYDIKGNVAYKYMEQGQVKEGEISSARNIQVIDPAILRGGTIRASVTGGRYPVAASASINNIVSAGGGAGYINYQWYVSEDNYTWTPIADYATSDSYILPYSSSEGIWYYRRTATDSGSPKQTANSNVVSIEYYRNPIPGPTPTTPNVSRSKDEVQAGGYDYVQFTVTNYSSYAPNTTFEWRTNGYWYQSMYPPQMNYSLMCPPNNGSSYLELECRVWVDGRPSAWSSKHYIYIRR